MPCGLSEPFLAATARETGKTPATRAPNASARELSPFIHYSSCFGRSLEQAMHSALLSCSVLAVHGGGAVAFWTY